MKKTKHFFADEAEVTPAQVTLVIREQMDITEIGQTDALRTAVMYLPTTMPPSVWVAGALAAGINEGTARNRLHDVRKFQRELGEI